MRAKTLTEIFLTPTLVCIHCKLTLYAATHDRVTDFMLGMCSNKGIEVFFFYPSIAGDRPKLHELQLLEDIDGRTNVRVIERVAPDWKNLAIALGFDQSRLKIIEKDYRGSTEEACREMFTRWLDGEHDLAQPCTWDTLIKCLRRALFIKLANNLREILNQ